MSIIHFQSTVGAGGALKAEMSVVLISTGIYGYQLSPPFGTFQPDLYRGRQVRRLSSSNTSGSTLIHIAGADIEADFFESIRVVGGAYDDTLLAADASFVSITDYGQWNWGNVTYWPSGPYEVTIR